MESYALFIGLEFIISFKILKVLILEDSLLVIIQAKNMVSKDEAIMGQLKQRIFVQLDHFKEVNLFHISRHNNRDGDRLTNDIITLKRSFFFVRNGCHPC